MRTSSDLVKLCGVTTGRLRRLGAEITAVSGVGTSINELDRKIGRVVIETHNTWCNFSRSYLMSYLAAPRRRRGDRVRFGNLSANSPGNLLHIAAKACRGPLANAPVDRRDEPAWHDIGNFLRICNALAPSNLSEIQAALSMQTRVFADLPAFRNFYAHRNEESAAKAVGLARRQYLITGVRHPTEVLMKPAPARTQPILLDWLDEMQIVVTFLCD